MINNLNDLAQLARHDKEIKEKLLTTRKESDPMVAFCKCCSELGFEITVGELFSMGLDMNDEKLRSVNGGGVGTIDGWDDAYEMFFCSIM